MKGKIWTFMAKRCEHCPLCRHAREKPDSLFGKMMALHGKLCPFWRAWQAEFGAKQEPTQTAPP